MVCFSKKSLLSFMLLASISIPHLAFAAAYYLPEYESKWSGFASSDIPLFSQDNDAREKCIAAGYPVTTCPAGSASKESERCPYSFGKSYYKKCYSYSELCQKEGYVLTCPEGKELSTSSVCPYDSLYAKCECSPCVGYLYTEAEANSEGYIADGEACISCGEYKYKRKINSCNGFDYDVSNCGISSCGRLEGNTCQSGSTIKYQKCEACAAPVPSCDAPMVNVENYWCGNALKCWMPATVGGA